MVSVAAQIFSSRAICPIKLCSLRSLVKIRAFIIKYDVPQDPVVGSLLFLLYINDISNTSNRDPFVLRAEDINTFWKVSQ
jgi:hypothetical protein